MTMFWTDFATDTLDAAPAGWTLNGWLAGEFVVVSDATAGGGKALKLAPAVTNADEYRFLRDGAEIRAWGRALQYVDAAVSAGVSHSYTYQARNPGGASQQSAAVLAARAAQGMTRVPKAAPPSCVRATCRKL